MNNQLIVIRGGSWYNLNIRYYLSAKRYKNYALLQDSNFGFSLYKKEKIMIKFVAIRGSSNKGVIYV